MFIKIQSERPVRVAVIGAGVFGGFHSGKYAAHPDVELVAVVDLDIEKARAVAEKHGARGVRDLDEVIGAVDAVSVAAPAKVHYALARRALEAGLHCLVEKPIALDIAHADELVAIARRKGLALQVGHQERYVFSEFGLLSRDAEPVYVECRRAGPFSGRGTDVSVVMDLMIHDLDLVHQVAPAGVRRVEAQAEFVHGDLADEVTADLTLENGTEVRLFASRNADDKQRSMRLVYTDGEIFLDFVNRTLTNTTPAKLESAFGGEERDGAPAIASDPLGYGIARFIQCVQCGEEPVVTGAQARRALATALAITESHGPKIDAPMSDEATGAGREVMFA